MLNNITFSNNLTLNGLYSNDAAISLSYENSIKENLHLANQSR
jgi:hypothetical protein